MSTPQLGDENKFNTAESKSMKMGYDEFSQAVKLPGPGSVGAGDGGAGNTRLESF